MNRSLSYLAVLIIMLTILNGCVCYRSHLDISIVKHGLWNESESEKIYTRWDGRIDPYPNPKRRVPCILSMYFERDIEKEGYGRLTIGFSRQPGNVSEVVIKSISLTDKRGEQVSRLKPFEVPAILPFKEKYYSCCECKGEREERIYYDNADMTIHPYITTRLSPYKIHLKGHYVRNNNSIEPIDTEIIMSVKRKRWLDPVPACWP